MYIWDVNMPSWLVKPSSNEVKRKSKRGSLIAAIHRKFKCGSLDKKASKSGRSHKFSIDIPSTNRSSLSTTSAPPFEGSHCQTFPGDPYAQPLPLPVVPLPSVGCPNSGSRTSSMELRNCAKPYPISSLSNVYNPQKSIASDAWGDVVTGSVSSDSSIDTSDRPDSRRFSPQASDFESGNVTAINSPTRHKDQPPFSGRRLLKDVGKGKVFSLPSNNSAFRERRPVSAHVTNLHIPSRAGFISAPQSSLSSPLLSPVRTCSKEYAVKSVHCVGRPCTDAKLGGGGHYSSTATCHISGHDTVRDQSLLSPQSRCSSECSPILSPRVYSPGCISNMQSGGLAQFHCKAGGPCNESSLDRSDGGKVQSHKLPLPPKIPGRIDALTSPVSRWKKGRLIGSGTFGQVYLGFNSETGEMCAMKEVALFSDDPKSKECVQQLEQEITLLSRLRHPNIVRYFGSDTVDNKLYIYLEYVSGGSIHKLLQDYGHLGESAIRSFTQQILSGLAYLHAKNTVHRDIKGANILVDPRGRVKLADFGMAKHITQQSGPLSFKGSPYWMAPEVIRNSNGSNLAVDIWSLGCTVLEMATAKPPWSQYEGVAALFKVGNSKELPAIPDHLPEDGKDFVRKCLQRNPLDRPKAAELLEHPFVKNAATPERCVLNSRLSSPFDAVANASRYMGTGGAKNVSGLDLEGVAVQLSRVSKFETGFRTSKHQSCPVSPIGSPLLYSKTTRKTCRQRYPARPNPQTASGSCTPLNSAGGASGSCTPLNDARGAFRGSDLYHSRPGRPHESLSTNLPRDRLIR